MPTVPQTSLPAQQPTNPSVQPSQTDLLMAAATMHEQASAPRPKRKGKPNAAK